MQSFLIVNNPNLQSFLKQISSELRLKKAIIRTSRKDPNRVEIWFNFTGNIDAVTKDFEEDPQIIELFPPTPNAWLK